MKPTPNDKKASMLVLNAIHTLRESTGSSFRKILKYIEAQHGVSQSFKRNITKAIGRGVAFGAIKKLKGRYKLGGAVQGIKSHRRRRSKSSNRKARRGRSRRRRHHH